MKTQLFIITPHKYFDRNDIFFLSLEMNEWLQDVAGRGIDIIEVNLVVQYSPPQNIAEFVHRVGRTARAGRSGQAILFMGPNETEFIRRLEDKRIRISQGDVEQYLKVLTEADSEAHTAEEAASNLQHKFELLLADDEEIHDKASKGM